MCSCSEVWHCVTTMVAIYVLKSWEKKLYIAHTSLLHVIQTIIDDIGSKQNQVCSLAKGNLFSHMKKS